MFQLALASKFCFQVLLGLSCQHCKTDLILGISLHELNKKDMVIYFVIAYLPAIGISDCLVQNGNMNIE
jgi:hypothetical protein